MLVSRWARLGSGSKPFLLLSIWNTHTHTERDRERDRETERQRERQTETETETETKCVWEKKGSQERKRKPELLRRV